MRKFTKRWFGPYKVRKVTNNATYYLNKLDKTEIQMPIAGKRIKMQRMLTRMKDAKDAQEDGGLLNQDK